MAFHKIKDFAKLCGVQMKHMSTYIQRKKVVVSDNDLVDDSDQINSMFIEKMKVKRLKEPVEQGSPVKKPAPEEEVTQDEEREESELAKTLREKAELDMVQKRGSIELQRIDIQKKRGELVPTQAVLNLIVLQAESQKNAFVEASDNLLVILSQQFQMNPTQVSDIRNKFLKIVNTAIDSSIDSSKRMLKSVVKEYSVKRGVGQHD